MLFEYDVSCALYNGKAGSLTTEPRANGCCDHDRVEFRRMEKKRNVFEKVRTRWKTIGVA